MLCCLLLHIIKLRIFQNSSLERLYTSHRHAKVLKEYTYKIRASEQQNKDLKFYFDSLKADMIIFGLKFSYQRVKAQAGGYLMPGRKSKVKRETLLLTAEQAIWRLNNWKAMIRNYRRMGYSYPTISRIKKTIKIIASTNSKYKRAKK